MLRDTAGHRSRFPGTKAHASISSPVLVHEGKLPHTAKMLRAERHPQQPGGKHSAAGTVARANPGWQEIPAHHGPFLLNQVRSA